MFLAAARTIAEFSPARRDPTANLLAPLADIRKLTVAVAIAVAKQAVAEALAAPVSDETIAVTVHDKMWEPLYAPYRRLPSASAG